MTATSFVYFIQRGDEDGPIKVGYSSNPAARLLTLQGSHLEPLRLIGLTPGGRFAEARLHAALRPWSLGREWYSPAPEVYACIEEDVPPVAPALNAVLEAKTRIGYAVRFLREVQAEAARDELIEARDRIDEAIATLPAIEVVA